MLDRVISGGQTGGRLTLPIRVYCPDPQIRKILTELRLTFEICETTILTSDDGIFGSRALRIISKVKLRDFWATHPESEAPLSAWYRNVENADWGKPQDVRETYRSADPIGDEFVVFDICKDNYRLVVCVDYEQSIVYVWGVLTHAQYDRINFQALADQKRREKRERSGH